jgi:beta-glucosidase
VKFTLDRRAFAYYDVARKDWVVEEGDFELLFGSSSRDLRGSANLFLTSTIRVFPPVFDRNTIIGDVCSYPPTSILSKKLRRDFSGTQMSPVFLHMFRTMESSFPIRMKVTLGHGEIDFDDIDQFVEQCKKLAGVL